MPLPKRPRDPIARAKLVMDMLTGEQPNDKQHVLAALGEQQEPQELTQHAKAATARAASQTAARRSEVARKAAAARWDG
jgi:hypothetical protein